MALAHTEPAVSKNEQFKSPARAIFRNEQAEMKQFQRWLQVYLVK